MLNIDTYKKNGLFSGELSRKSYQSLINENATLRSIIETLEEGVVVSDRTGHLVFFNDEARTTLGIGLQNIAMDEWSSVYGTYYPDKKTPFPSENLPLARALQGDDVRSELIFIKNALRRDGVFIEVSAYPLYDDAGETIGGVAIIRDVTSLKEAEIARKQSEDRVKAQFKGFPIPTYVWQSANDDFILIDYNVAADQFTSGQVKKFIGRKSSEIFADTPDVMSDFKKSFSEKKTVRREMSSYRLRTTNENKEMVFNYVFVPPNLVVQFTEDITEQKIAEKELLKLSKAIEQTADTVIITNKDGFIEYVNSAFEITTGYSCAEAIGKTPRLLQSGMHDKNFYKNIWQTILSNNHYKGTIINRKKNGELYWSDQTITPMKDDNGNITHFVSVLKDITELRKKQEQEFQLSIAREIQQKLFRTKIHVPGFDIAGATYPAVETSGDYFDFITLPGGQCIFIVADVSGHGIGSALIMTETRAFLRAFLKIESDPGILLTWLNRELFADLDMERYVTLVLAKIDPENKTLEYASAGHPTSYIMNKNGDVAHELKSTGIPLGIIQNARYRTEETIQMAAGDLAVFLTDGIVEAHGQDNEEFGVDRTLTHIRTNSHRSAREIIEVLYSSVLQFTKNQTQEDDITSIICKVESEK
ncbi:MAG: SpoIIE family protein phosphatase [Candidatus Zhuqueibacterota bacterium]